MSPLALLQRAVQLQAVVAAAVVSIVAVIVGLAHGRAYFFLYDDFAVVGEASLRPAAELLTTPRFDFYRPAAFLLTRAAFAVLGWSHPGAYIASALAFHAACAALIYVLVRRLRQDHPTGLLASALFLLSPWASEPYFWYSGVFDRLAAFGTIASLVLGTIVLDAPNRARAWSAGVAGCLTAAVAVFAKEIGVILPPLFGMTVVLAYGPRTVLHLRALVYGASLVAVCAAYLIVRERALPGLQGGYGDLRSLVRNATLVSNVLTHVRALVVLPLPGISPGSLLSPARIAAGAFELSVAAALALAFWKQWRVGLLAAIGIGAAIAPVSWVALIAGSSAGNRFLYLPGVWFAMVLAVGLRELQRRAARPAWAVVSCACATVIYGYAVTSVACQAKVWVRASELARASIEQIAPHAGSAQRLFIANLPAIFVDGPYVVSETALRYYFKRADGSTRLRPMALKYERKDVWLSFWLENAPPPPPAADERVVRLDLPIRTLTPNPVGRLESPSAGAVVDQPFTIRGWAVDTGSPRGTGVDAVHVYAYPDPGTDADAIFLGAAQYGRERFDVGESVGAQFANSEFALKVTALRPGRYRLVVFPHDVLTGGFPAPLTVTVVVR